MRRQGYQDGYNVGMQTRLQGDWTQSGVRFWCDSMMEHMLVTGNPPGDDWGQGCTAGATRWIKDNGG